MAVAEGTSEYVQKDENGGDSREATAMCRAVHEPAATLKHLIDVLGIHALDEGIADIDLKGLELPATLRLHHASGMETLLDLGDKGQCLRGGLERRSAGCGKRADDGCPAVGDVLEPGMELVVVLATDVEGFGEKGSVEQRLGCGGVLEAGWSAEHGWWGG